MLRKYSDSAKIEAWHYHPDIRYVAKLMGC